ncbi:MAG: hypothetical protein WC635_10345 [Bacteriovorax sp.]
MNIVSLSLVLFLTISFTNVHAEVWHSKEEWSESWENEYRQWVNKNLRTDVFTSEEGLLGGLATDCADALYAIRIQFAYENSLPFVINAPDVLKPTVKIFGSDTAMFDKITDEKKRVRAFMKFVMAESGTNELMKDTFPVQIKKINSGIVYVVEWSLFGKMNRHSYIIKGFDQDGELLYYASDAPVKVRKLQVDTKYPRFSYDSAPFGFRKWKQPSQLLIPEKNISPSAGYSIEQYTLLESIGKKYILKEIRNILKNR